MITDAPDKELEVSAPVTGVETTAAPEIDAEINLSPEDLEKDWDAELEAAKNGVDPTRPPGTDEGEEKSPVVTPWWADYGFTSKEEADTAISRAKTPQEIEIDDIEALHPIILGVQEYISKHPELPAEVAISKYIEISGMDVDAQSDVDVLTKHYQSQNIPYAVARKRAESEVTSVSVFEETDWEKHEFNTKVKEARQKLNQEKEEVKALRFALPKKKLTPEVPVKNADADLVQTVEVLTASLPVIHEKLRTIRLGGANSGISYELPPEDLQGLEVATLNSIKENPAAWKAAIANGASPSEVIEYFAKKMWLDHDLGGGKTNEARVIEIAQKKQERDAFRKLGGGKGNGVSLTPAVGGQTSDLEEFRRRRSGN